VIALLVAATALAGGDSASLTGLWRTPTDGGSIVRLEPCGDGVCARIVTSPRLRANPGQTDGRNKDPALRGRAVRGLLTLQLRYKAPGQWGDGWAYDPTNGGTYRGSMTLTPDGRLRLTGCIVVPLCRTQTWTRAD
jgi:uncharacterized protein (DUF2147 family)